MFDCNVLHFRYYEPKMRKMPGLVFCPLAKYAYPKVAEFVFNKGYQNKMEEHKIWCTNNTAVSLYRFEQKLLYNRVAQNRPINLFLTLTIDEVHYDEACNQATLSETLRKFLNKVQLYHKRRGLKFSYAWRVERGSQSTKRLHVHMICFTEANMKDLKKFIYSRWNLCLWDILEKDAIEKGNNPPFCPCEDNDLIMMYIIKYTSKKIKHTKYDWQTGCEETWFSVSMRKVKDDLQCRLTGTSRDWEPVPKHILMYFDLELLSWSPRVKFNYKIGSNGSVEQIGFWEKRSIRSFHAMNSWQGLLKIMNGFYWKHKQQMLKMYRMKSPNLRTAVKIWLLWKKQIVDKVKEFADCFDYDKLKRKKKRMLKEDKDSLGYFERGRKDAKWHFRGYPDYDCSDFDYDTFRFLEEYCEKMKKPVKKVTLDVYIPHSQNLA